MASSAAPRSYGAGGPSCCLRAGLDARWLSNTACIFGCSGSTCATGTRQALHTPRALNLVQQWKDMALIRTPAPLLNSLHVPRHDRRHRQGLLWECRKRSSSGSRMCLSQCSLQRCTCASQASALLQRQHMLPATLQLTQTAHQIPCCPSSGISRRSSTCRRSTRRAGRAHVSRCQQLSP